MTIEGQYSQNTRVMYSDACCKPIALELFAGCGGMTLGLKRANFTVIGAIENDPLAVDSYLVNHPDVVLWASDIRSVNAPEIMEAHGLCEGQLDLLAGCPPCQGFSSIRTLNGSKTVDDPRNDLLFEFIRFIDALKPKAVMLENTPALAKDQRMERFFHELQTRGYDGDYPIANAADYGVPQRRRRMILLASRFGRIPFPDPDPKRLTVRSTIEALPPAGESGDPLHDVKERRSRRILDVMRQVPKNGGSRAHLGPERQLPCHQRCNGFKDTYGRMAWDSEAPTITSGCFNPSKGRFIHPEADRATTLREAALLQGLPPKYYVSLRLGKSRAAAIIGNALPPEFVSRHAVCVRQHLKSIEEVN